MRMAGSDNEELLRLYQTRDGREVFRLVGSVQCSHAYGVGEIRSSRVFERRAD